ncbi:MAG: 2Fe-2S iron-sulfur cluster-binding protein, partial [Spirochaetales bacterium]|nr:2Fe-2S iron-sulfur cluster-binding protein [Spirochaetales bacterium]
MKEIKLEIDGIEVSAREGQSVLNAALDAGIFIPNICSHPDLSPQGECKLCVVELRGETVLSCRTEAAEGMKVVTKSEHLAHLRNTAMELMLASHPHDCTSCRSYLNCELQSMMQYLESVHARLRSVPKKNIKWNTNNPIILREMERCIQCGRCVRACRELRDVGILEYRVLDGE